MAGVKGRSGGARSGAGRPREKKETLKGMTAKYDDPKAFLLAVMNDTEADDRLRVDAAKALLSAEKKKGEQGKKEEKAEAAKKAASGRFAPSAPPKVVAFKQ